MVYFSKAIFILVPLPNSQTFAISVFINCENCWATLITHGSISSRQYYSMQLPQCLKIYIFLSNIVTTCDPSVWYIDSAALSVPRVTQRTVFLRLTFLGISDSREKWVWGETEVEWSGVRVLQNFIGCVKWKHMQLVFWIIFTWVMYPYNSLEVSIVEMWHLKVFKARKNNWSILERKEIISQFLLTG